MGECQYQIFSAFRLAIAFVFLCLSAQADVIFSNVTSTGSPSYADRVCGQGEFGCGQDCGDGCALLNAAAFTPTGDYVMTDAQLLLESAYPLGYGIESSFGVDLYSSLNGLPGSLIESIGSGLAPSPPGALLTFDLPTPIPLTAGTQYWIVLSPGSGSYLYWDVGDPPPYP